MSNELAPYRVPGSLIADEGVRVQTPHLDTGPTRELQRPDEDKPQLAQLRLIQRKDMPFEGCEPGHYALTSTQETFERALVIPLDYLPDAQAWRPPYDPAKERQDPPYCWSDDGLMPGEMTERRPMSNRQSGPCYVAGEPDAGCPYNKWDRTTDPVTPPACTRVRRFMVLVLTPDGNKHVAQFSAWRTALKNVRNQLTPKVEAGACAKLLVFGSEYVREKGGYYVPTFAFFRDLTEDGRHMAIAERADAWAQIERGEVEMAPVHEDEDEDFADPTATDTTPEVAEDTIPF